MYVSALVDGSIFCYRSRVFRDRLRAETTIVRRIFWVGMMFAMVGGVVVCACRGHDRTLVHRGSQDGVRPAVVRAGDVSFAAGGFRTDVPIDPPGNIVDWCCDNARSVDGPAGRHVSRAASRREAVDTDREHPLNPSRHRIGWVRHPPQTTRRKALGRQLQPWSRRLGRKHGHVQFPFRIPSQAENGANGPLPEC